MLKTQLLDSQTLQHRVKSKFSPTALTAISLAITLAVSSQANAANSQNETQQDSDIEVITVSADFRQTDLINVPSSVTVVDAKQLEDEGAQHFEDVLNSIANFNWSGGSSRPKYFQIRGVGEQEDYQGAPNSSVGYVIDDIDLSGLGMVSSTYDLQQIEVLRGPQGTRYGANALAGLIYLKSNDPSDVFEHGAELSLGDDNLSTLSGYSSGPLSDTGKLLYRVSLQQHNQNGFRDNLYLGTDDTNKRDEFTGRVKLRWFVSDDLTADFTLLHANFDNGYDVWTLDNNGFDSLTDAPGVDSQKTTGSSLKLNYTGADKYNITSITSFASTKHDYGFDGDWANPDYWASKECSVFNQDWSEQIGTLPCVYDATWFKTGKRKNTSQEFRFTSKSKILSNTTDWLLGFYFNSLEEDNSIIDYAKYSTNQDKPIDVYERTKTLTSEYNAQNYAIFGQFDSDLSNQYTLSTGLRLEHRKSDYSDSNADEFQPSESMWGGHIALNKAVSNTQNAYIRIAKGYKAGGFNMSLPAEFSDKKQFDTETLYNYEIGLKSFWLNNSLSTNLAIFYMDRRNQQVAASQQSETDKSAFILFTDNAGSSKNYGFEVDSKWQATDTLELYASLGYLIAEYGDYKYETGENVYKDLSGRELAHSPKFTNSLGATYRADNGIFMNLNTSGKAKFFYSDSNDSQSKAYQIMNARVGYEADTWSVYLWGRNLFDKKYGVRGFYFGNEPDQGWADKQYIRYGDPRSMGVTANITF